MSLDIHNGQRRFARMARTVWVRSLALAVTVVPKDNNSAVLAAPTHDDDTVLAVVRELRSRNIAATVLVRRPPAIAGLYDHAVLSKLSTRGFWCYLRSRYVFFTHGLYGSPPPRRRQIIVNLWHGMPIKRIGRDDNGHCPQFTFTLATSQRFRRIIAGAFDCPDERVVLTGLPRADVLSDPDVSMSTRARLALPERYAVYLPTYRRSVLGVERVDGDVEAGQLTPADAARLSSALEAAELELVIKPHPMASLADYRSWAGPGMRLLSDAELSEAGVTLYQLLAGSSSLVTDFSSVAIDYLVTQKPIVLFMPDLERYSSDRGMYFSRDELERLGTIVLDPAGLAEAIAVLPERGHLDRPDHDDFFSCEPSGAAARVVDLALSWPTGR